MGIRQFGGAEDLAARCLRLPIGNVVPNGAVEQYRLLQHEADLLAERLLLKSPDIVSIDLHRTGDGVVKPGNQTDERGLARTGRSYQGHHLAGLNSEA